tara:strand:- start:253 stop:894 length:642 start_codon:yes stop_codon:yes gene_type:complete
MNILKKIIFGSILSLSSLVFAEVSLSGNIGLTTDYIWRGMTQNDSNPSVSGGFDLEDDSGFYFGVWAANVEADDDDEVAGSGSMELDGYLGYSGSFNDDAGYDIGYIAYTYPDYGSWDFEELYITFDFYGVHVSYAAGMDDMPDYSEVGYGIDAGPGSFSISYGDYETKGENVLIGYDWGVGDFTLGFYFYDFSADDASGMTDDDGGYFSISY